MHMSNDSENMLSMETVLKSLARLCAIEAGIALLDVRLEDGRELGCNDTTILSIFSGGKSSSVKISHQEMESFLQADGLVRANEKLRHAVSRLQSQLGTA
jgi:hypothetical protein